MQQSPPKHLLPAVSTILTPGERMRVDAAGEGSYRAIHRDGVAELVRDIKSRRADAVLLSVARCDDRMQPGICAMVREFPRVATVALVSQAAPDAPRVALSLGTSGITQLVDVREPTGWHELRRLLLTNRGSEIQREALTQLAIDLAGAEPDCWRFFEALFTAPPRVATVRALSREFAVLPKHAHEQVLSHGVAGAEAIPGHRPAHPRRPALRESRLFHRQRREPSRLLVAPELWATRADAATDDRRRVQESVRRSGDAPTLSRNAGAAVLAGASSAPADRFRPRRARPTAPPALARISFQLSALSSRSADC